MPTGRAVLGSTLFTSRRQHGGRRLWSRAAASCVATAVALLVPLVAMPAGTAGVGRAAAAVPVLVIDGKGDGHGVGMAQDGALEMGIRGASLGQILAQFYPGTVIGHAGGDVRVPVLGAGAAPSSAQVTFPDGGQVVDTLSGSQSPGFPVSVPAGATVVLAWDGTHYSVPGAQAAAAALAPMAPAASPAPATVQTAGATGQVSAVGPGAAAVTPIAASATTTTRPAARTTPTTAAPSLFNLLPILPPAPTTTAPRTTAPRRPGGGAGGSPGAGGGGSQGGASASTHPAPSTPPVTPTSTRPLWAVPTGGGAIGVPGRGRSYRGVIEAEGGTGSLRLVNQVDVETYLTGMGEVLDPGWPLAALETQEVAARTYALRAMAAGGEVCDDTRCQVYLGTAGEYPAAQEAVAATRGEVLYAGGGLADAVYSANAGGFSATPEEGFGFADGSYPYLRAAPYPTGDPLPWTVPVGTGEAGARLGMPGPLTGATVTSRGPSGRALTVTVTAGSASKVISGLDFAAALGLRSTLIQLHMSEAASAPPQLLSLSVLQVPPDQVRSLAGSAPAATEGVGAGFPAGAVDAAMRPAGSPTRQYAPAPPWRPGPGLPWGPVAVLSGLAVVAVEERWRRWRSPTRDR